MSQAEAGWHGRRTDATSMTGMADMLALLALVAAVAWPLSRTDLPLLYDYPNHLARMRVLSDASPDLASMYARHWALYPNLAMDLVVPLLARVMPLADAGRAFILMVVLLSVAGPVALHRAAFGGRSPWPYAAGLTAFNAILTMGFLNYLAGIGCAFLGTAALLRARRRSLAARAAAAAAIGAACLVCHLFGWALFALLLASVSARDALAELRARRRPRAALPPLAAFAVPLALYLTWGPDRSYGGADMLGTAVGQLVSGRWGHALLHFVWLLGAFASPGGPGVLASAVVVFGAALVAALAGRLAVQTRLLPALAVVATGWLLLPSTLADNAMTYQRLGLPTVLLGIASVSPRLDGPRWSFAWAAACASLLAVISASAGGAWRAQADVVAGVREVIAGIPPRAKVLAVRDGSFTEHADPDEPEALRVFPWSVAYAHLPALVTLDRAAFWPMLFSQPGKQPISPTPAFTPLVQDDGYLPLTSQLADPAAPPPQLAAWRTRYDYLLRLNARADWTPDPALRQVARSGFAVLYRIEP